MRSDLTATKLREVLRYDPETGFFWRLVDFANNARAGSKAGSKTGQGYVCIGIGGHRYRANRLAWLYMTGEWPTMDVDHKNGIHGDDRWSNLRLATKTQNRANARIRKDSSSGLKGVRKYRNRWQARITGSGVYLGSFGTPQEAHAAYVAAAILHYGDFAKVK